MRGLIKVIITLSIIFSSAFFIAYFFEIVDYAQIESWLTDLKQTRPLYVILIIIALLSIDILITIPTLALTTLAGHLLGLHLGAFVATTGMLLAGIIGYQFSSHLGERFIKFILSNKAERQEMEAVFDRYGHFLILLSRAVPMLPEISACLAGVSKLSFRRFILLWMGATLPYAYIASYAGSVATIEEPKKALIIISLLILGLWLLGLALQRLLRPSKL